VPTCDGHRQAAGSLIKIDRDRYPVTRKRHPSHPRPCVIRYIVHSSLHASQRRDAAENTTISRRGHQGSRANPFKGSRWLNSGSGEFFATRNSLEPSALPSTTLPSKTTPVSEGGRRYSRCVRACVRDAIKANTRCISAARIFAAHMCAAFHLAPYQSAQKQLREEEFPEQDSIHLDEHVPRARLRHLALASLQRLREIGSDRCERLRVAISRLRGAFNGSIQ